MRRFLILVSVLLLGACVQPVSPEKLANIRTIGVISAIGEKAYFQTIGYTVFGNDLKTLPIKNWGIDQRVVAEISKELGGRYQIVPVSYDASAFLPEKISEGGWLSPSDRHSVADIVRSSATPQGLDAYIVVLEGGSGFGNTNQNIGGLGLLKTHGSLFSYVVFAHALYSIWAIDGHQFNRIGFVAPAATNNDLMAVIHGPYEEVDAPYWAKADDLPSDQQLVMLKAKLENLIAKTLPGAIGQLGLTR